MVQPYRRCFRCGSPTKRKGGKGPPTKYCYICSKRVNVEQATKIKIKKYHNKMDYVHKLNKQLRYSEKHQIDYCTTPFGLYKVLGSRDSESYALNERERDLLRGTKDEKWRKKKD